MHLSSKTYLLLFLIFFFYASTPSYAKIIKLEITKTESYTSRKQYGGAGKYIRIFGKAYGEVDPTDSSNSIIRDYNRCHTKKYSKLEYICLNKNVQQGYRF